MEIQDLASVGLTRGELVSLTFDPSPEADPSERWVVSIGPETRGAGETPELALGVALLHFATRRRPSAVGE